MLRPTEDENRSLPMRSHRTTVPFFVIRCFSQRRETCVIAIKERDDPEIDPMCCMAALLSHLAGFRFIGVGDAGREAGGKSE